MFPVRCNRSPSGARFAACLGSRDGKPVQFEARRGSAPRSDWNPGNDLSMENPTMPRLR